jgi:GNAT superfamily N-acetyltransferase
MPSPTDNVQIGPAPPGQVADAMRLVFAHLAEPDRTEQVRALMDDPGGVSPEGVLVARRGGRLVGAVLAQVHPGRTAVVWPPRLADDEPQLTAGRLLAAACRMLHTARVRVAHVLLQAVTLSDDAVLRGEGFEPLAELLYMVSESGDFPTALPPDPLAPDPLEYEPYCRSNHERLARLVSATYQETLDCPTLNGVRQIEDILTGYRGTGEFDPSQWLIVRRSGEDNGGEDNGGEDVGCLLLADYPQHGNCELVYMGLVVSARGHGWGMHIARHAQWLAGRMGRERLVLAVDATNTPAIQMYAAVGFRPWDRRDVYVQLFE